MVVDRAVVMFHFRKAVSLNKNEGIYVRDIRNGQVSCFLISII